MMKKIVSSIILCAILISTLVSCGKSVEKRMEKAEEYIISDPYTVSVSIDFTAAEGVEAIFTEISTRKTKVYFRGANYHAENEEVISAGEDVYYFKTDYTSVGGTLYKDIYNTENDALLGETFSRAAISAEQSEKLANHLCLIGGVDAEGFADSTEIDRGRKSLTMRYENASDEVKAALVEMMNALSMSVFESVTAGAATLTVSIEDNKYSTAALECDFEVTLDGVAYAVTARVTLSFDYSDSFSISHPVNADEYEKIDLEKLLPF